MTNPDNMVFVTVVEGETGFQLVFSAHGRNVPEAARAQVRGRGWLPAAGLAVEVSRPIRVESHAVPAGAFTFPTPFTAPPEVDPIPVWSGDQVVLASASNVTKTGCTITLKRSRATLLLSSGPFETAPQSTQGRIRVIGK